MIMDQLHSKLAGLPSEEVRHPCALHHYFYIPRPRFHIKLYIECDFNYMKAARRRMDVVPPLVYQVIQLISTVYGTKVVPDSFR